MRLGKRVKREKEPKLIMIVPPRTGERTLLAIENLLQALAVEEPFSLELAGSKDGVSFLVRTYSPEVFRQQVAIHYPQASMQELSPKDDPLTLRPGERIYHRILTLAGPEFLPLRTFRDDDLLDPGSDPLLAILGALSPMEKGERLVSRLILRSLGHDWSLRHQRRALVPAFSRALNQPYQSQSLKMDGMGLMFLMIPLLLGLQNYVWLREGQILRPILLDAGVAAGTAMAVPLVWRWLKNRNRVYDNRLVQEKVSRSAFLAELHLAAIVPDGQEAEIVCKLLSQLTTAYQHYNLSSGNHFKTGKLHMGMPDNLLAFSSRKPWQSRSVLNTRELSTLWHPPGVGDEVPLLERTGPRLLHPLAKGIRDGALVGQTTTAGRGQNVRFPEDLLRQNHLYVAKTRMGKSTLIQHIVGHKMIRKADGHDNDAIVVIDPHSDLVRSILALVPQKLAEDVYLADLADQDRVLGINLLDTNLFPDRDHATDNIVQIVKHLWEQWGPRMQSILEHTLKSLYEANRHSSVGREEQYTILDGLHLLSDEGFRKEVLSKVHDPYLIRWWARDFRDWHRQYRADAIAPVQTRLAYYASSEKARAILGQSTSTLDIPEIIREGKVLLVNTAQGQVGKEVAALMGGTFLNLLDGVIRTQESLPPAERRRVLVVIDEMQTIPGADYEGMLSELGKFGASFVMATQSLARLEHLSDTLRETLFSNVGCLITFQVSAHDAKYLVWELDKNQLNETDLTSLPAYHCYVRATVGGQKLPTFSMVIRPPDSGNPAVMEVIRRRYRDYTNPRQEVSTRLENKIEGFISQFRQDLVMSQAVSDLIKPDDSVSNMPRRSRRIRSHTRTKPKMAHEQTPEEPDVHKVHEIEEEEQ